MKISDKAILNLLFDRFTKYLDTNNSVIRFKYEDNKVKYCIIKDNHHNTWYDVYDKCNPIKDIDLKDERLNFLVPLHYS